MRQSAPLVYPPENEIRHGVHYIPRSKEPSMFEILSWKERYDAASDNNWLVRLKEGNREGRFTETKKYERIEYAPLQSREKEKDVEIDHHLHPHQIKHELYYYGEEETGKAAKKQRAKSPPKPKDKVRKEITRLDQFNEQDKREIKIRKQNIQKFDAFTRQLPNSAFTTYFGKPAFAHYGTGAAPTSPAIAAIKSHSVMPHAGKNHPEFVQSHEGALSKANVINLESYVPRSPIGNPPLNDCKVAIKEYYNVEIVKPDLVNQVRFSNTEKEIKFREKTPKHDELNYLPKRVYAKSPPAEAPKKQKPKKKSRYSQQKIEDRLAFMNKRQNFMKEVKEKQKLQERLAYKVTECYPYDWENETQAASTARQQKWKQIRPAGISSSRSLNATNFRSL